MTNKCLRAALVSIALFAAGTASAQALAQVTMIVTLQQPMPRSFAEWQRNDRTLVVVTITNWDPVDYRNVRLSGYVRDVDKDLIVARTKDNDPNMPRFTIPAKTPVGAPGMLVLHGRECINASSIQIDNGLRTQAITTNSLPEGNFEFCAKLLKEDNTDLTASGGACPAFGVVIPDPPALVLPEDKQEFPAVTLPSFTWSQAAPVPPGTNVFYWLQIAPLFPSQTARDAIDRNEVLLRKPLPMTTYQYLPSDPQFSLYPAAVGFVWRVEALDETGKAVTHNEGKSEVRTFRFAALPVPPPPPLPEPQVSGGRR